MARQWQGLFLLMGAALALTVCVAGCGGSGSPANSSSTTASAKAREGSAEFDSSGNNWFVNFGTEGSASEIKAADSVLDANLKARAAADFEAQCATLSLGMIDKMVGPKQKDPAAACPEALKKIAEPLSASKEARKDTLDGAVGALRVKGAKGYALYHGNDGSDYAMPMEKQSGAWKVSALVTSNIEPEAKP
jgi:hypothetical protein